MAKVSVRIAHQRGCPNATRTALSSVGRGSGCECKPSYYTFHRDKLGRPVKGKRVRDRRAADQAATVLQGDIDAKRLGLHRREDVTFAEWADRWTAGDERAGGDQRKENTKRDYKWMIEHAKEAFGDAHLSELTGTDVERFLHALTKAGTERGTTPTPTTLAKHLRYLHACLEEAVPRYLPANPVDLLPKGRKPKPRSDKWDYFTDEELPRLWASFKRREDMLGLYLCKTAVTTGMRLGELSGLQRGDVDLNKRVVNVRRTYTAGVGITTPKSGKGRVVNLTEDAARILREWFELQGVRGREALVFANEADGHLDPAAVLKRKLYPAMKAARTADGKEPRKDEWGLPRVGERGNPRVFHSFRHTFARLVLENGGSREWLNKQLGHSSFAMTDRYSEWSDRRLAREAAGLSFGGI
jgi:integrase